MAVEPGEWRVRARLVRVRGLVVWSFERIRLLIRDGERDEVVVLQAPWGRGVLASDGSDEHGVAEAVGFRVRQHISGDDSSPLVIRTPVGAFTGRVRPVIVSSG